MFIYIIRSDAGPVKVGVSRSPESRLERLQAQQPFAARIVHTTMVSDDLARTIEAAAHRLLSAKRIRGEWFDVTDAEAIEAVHQAARDPGVGEEQPPTTEWRMPGKLVRACRAFLDWNQTDLAERSGVATITIKNIERGKGHARGTTLAKIQSTFEEAGLEILRPGQPTQGDGRGIRLRA